MNTLQPSITTGILFLFLFAFGFILSRTGKPYKTILFNVHKFIGLGLVVFLVVSLNRMHQAVPLTPAEITILVVTALLFAVTIVAGGLLDALESAPRALTTIHHWLPYITVISTAVSLYLVLHARA
ncbi:MAG: hypothetical protein PVI99_00455 [Anaerolineales bacterium]|jgi:hypothetical protein